MSRITEGEARGLMDAYRSIYEGYGEKKEKKGKKKVMHDCSTHCEHSEWGKGVMIEEMHTLDEEGNVSHYDIQFEHGIERNVPVEELVILEGKMHEHYVNDEKNAEVLDEDLIGDVLSNRGKIKSAATRAVTATNRAATATNKALGSAASDTARQAQTGVRQTAKDVAKGFQYGGATGAATALGANIVRGIATSGQPAKPPAAKPPAAKPPAAKPPAAKPPAAQPPAAKPPAAKPPAAQPPAAAKPAPSAPAAKPAAPQKSFNPLMQKTFGYQTGNAPDQIAKASAGAPPTPSGSALGAAAKPEVRKALNLPVKPATPTQATAAAPSTSASASGDLSKKTAEIAKKPVQPAVSPTPTQMRQGTFKEQVDAYDLVLDYLLENGHVDTLDEAHYVMLEMDSEMIQNIAEAKRKSYSAKKARKGEDLGLPGKGFEKIATEAGKRYGSKKRGEKVAGAVLAGLRAKYGK